MKETTPIWQVATVEEQAVERLKGELKVHDLVARILAARGVEDCEEGRRFISPRLADLHPPKMAGLEVAVERMGRAIEGGERIGVFGDYDVDGVTSTALIGDYLGLCGADVVLRVARRDEGYGFSADHASEMRGKGVALLMLVDCGTSDHEAVAAAQNSGMDVIALDHHQITREQWPGMSLINPQRTDCPFPYKGLASVGLAFYFIAALRRQLEQQGIEATDPREFLDLVALGTIADVAPLDGDNRILVASGLLQLRRTERPGLRELLRLCRIADRALTSTDVGWQLGPRLNAPGRMGDASTSLECLRLGEPEERRGFARECHSINEERKEIQGRILDAAMEQARVQVEGGATFLLLEGEDWHPGVIGIVASKIVDTFKLPAGIIALEGDQGRGSARSVPGFNLIEALSSCAAHMNKYGGHHGAAGFSLARDQVASLREALQVATAPALSSLPAAVLHLDASLGLDEIDLALCREVGKLGPFGQANPEPLFFSSSVFVERARLVGANHLAMTLRGERRAIPAIGFGLYDKCPEIGNRIDVAFVLEIDEYQSYAPRARIRLEDLRPALGEQNG